MKTLIQGGYVVGFDGKEHEIIKDGVDLTLSGRNLYVWTKYSGYDPEINLFGTNAGGVGSVQTTAADRGFDFGGYPIPRTWSLSARFTF